MFEVSPVATHRVTMNGADMIMSSHHGPGQPFQYGTESSGRHVEPAWLEPDPLRVWHPPKVICQIRICNEVLTTSSVRLQAVGDAGEGDDRHMSSLLSRSKLSLNVPAR